tara:strand:+ start:58047 stop:58322 length:276 start_codon:yes stop_codon:yes gene_type:complete
LGHKLASKVLEIEENNKGVKAGDKVVVVVVPYMSCGTCIISCRNEKTNSCSNIMVLGLFTGDGMQEQIADSIDILLLVHNLSYNQMAIVNP